MTISANDRRSGPYSASSGQTEFTYDFPIDAADEVRVTRLRDSVESTLILTTDYSVSGVGDAAGGTITLAIGATALDVVTIEGVRDDERATSISVDVRPQPLNTEYDRLTKSDQEIRRDVDRAIRIPRGEAARDALPPAATMAGRILAGDADGQGWDTDAPTVAQLEGLLDTASELTSAASSKAGTTEFGIFASLAQLALEPTTGVTAKVSGFVRDETEAANGTGRLATFLPDSTVTPDGYNVIRPDDRPASAGRWFLSDRCAPAQLETARNQQDAIQLAFNKTRRPGRYAGASALPLHLVQPHRVTRVVLSSAVALTTGTETKIDWESLQEDTAGAWAVGTPAALSVPASLDGCFVRVKLRGQFAANATGYRRLVIKKNGAAIYGGGRNEIQAAAGSVTTCFDLTTGPIRVRSGDYFEAFAAQGSGGNLNFDANADCSFEIEFMGVPNGVLPDSGLVCQGFYQNIAAALTGDYSADWQGFAKRCADFSVFVPSHFVNAPDDIAFPSETVSVSLDGCHDTKYAYIHEVILEYRRLRPDGRVFAYVSPAADAAAGTTCGYLGTYAERWPSGPPTTSLPNVYAWVDYYAALPEAIRPDGIFYDICADFSNGGYIDSTMRDLAYAYARSKGFALMVNSTNASYINVNFAAVGLGPTDIIMVEGYRFVAGVANTSFTDDVHTYMDNWLRNGPRIYGVCTSAWGVAPTSGDIATARTYFDSKRNPGDLFHMTSSDLGLVREVIDGPH